MDLKGIGWEGRDWIHLAQDRDKWRALVNIVMNLWVQQNVGNFFTTLQTINLGFKSSGM
jgi:hypothetical protein